MSKITDEYMKEMIAKTKEYTIVLLKPGPNSNQENVMGIIWEHARRNFELRAGGSLSVVCPVSKEGGLSGLYIFNINPEEAQKVMDGDPAVQAGIFVYEIYPCRSFPGDSLAP